MAKAWDATKPGPDGSRPLVEVLEIPYPATDNLAASLMPTTSPLTPSAYSAFIANVRRLLSQNRPVLVRGWSVANPCQFTRDGIARLRGSIDQQVQWQGVCMFFSFNA